MRGNRIVKRSRAGISEAMAAVLLLIAAIVVALSVWAYANSMISMQQTTADFTITSAEVRYLSTGGGVCRVFVTVRNSGGQTFRSLQLEVSGPNVPSLSLPIETIDLPPGRSYSTTATIPCGGYGWTAGTPVLLSVVLTTPPGAGSVTVRKNVNVMVQFGA
jgi:hypothetical protein